VKGFALLCGKTCCDDVALSAYEATDWLVLAAMLCQQALQLFDFGEGAAYAAAVTPCSEAGQGAAGEATEAHHAASASGGCTARSREGYWSQTFVTDGSTVRNASTGSSTTNVVPGFNSA
jgi:hypothetical protein